MGLNALLVHYDHGFFYDHALENVKILARDLELDLQILSSKHGWDKRYVRSISKAFASTRSYWGICKACQYILPASIVKTGLAEGIKFYMSHSNPYELSLRVPKETKVKALIRGIFSGGIPSVPKTLFYLLLAQYYLYRLKIEFYVPPLKNIFRGAPKKPFKTTYLSDYVPWDTDQMISDLTQNTGWKLPDHPNLGMRFDCKIEDSFVNTSYKDATGSTVHSIIASNLIYDGKKGKSDLTPAVDYYDQAIKDKLEEITHQVNLID